MVSVFCGVTNCPITSLILAIEMFDMAGMKYCALCIAVSYLLSGYYSLYNSQKIMYSKYRTEFINATHIKMHVSYMQKQPFTVLYPAGFLTGMPPKKRLFYLSCFLSENIPANTSINTVFTDLSILHKNRHPASDRLRHSGWHRKVPLNTFQLYPAFPVL